MKLEYSRRGRDRVVLASPFDGQVVRALMRLDLFRPSHLNVI